MNNPDKIHLLTAAKTGPLSMCIFLLMLAYFGQKSILEDSFILVLWLIGSIFTTIIAFAASLILFSTFESINSYFKLNLTPRAMYHYFLPIMVFTFGLVSVLVLSQGLHRESKAFLFTVDASALLGWSIYSYEKLKSALVERTLKS